MQAFRKQKQELLTNYESLAEYHGVQKAENVQCSSVASQSNLAVGDIDLDKESANVLEYDSLSKEGLQGEQILLCNHAVMYGHLSKITPTECLNRRTWKRM